MTRCRMKLNRGQRIDDLDVAEEGSGSELVVKQAHLLRTPRF